MSVFGMGVQQSRSTSDCSDSTQKPLELHRQAETGIFSDSESDVSDSDSDTDEETGVWMALPSALSSTGRTFRRIETQVVNNEEQLQLVKRRARKLTRTTADAAESGADPVSPRDFHKIKVIGVGGMGRVLLVRHRRDRKLYAMKVVSKKSVKEKDMAARVLSERDVLGGTCHHALVQLYWAFQTKDNFYEYLAPEILKGKEYETIIDGSNFRDEFTKVSLGSIDSPVGGGGFSESFKGFNFKASEDQQLEYGYSRDAQ
ncbi:hypothetical protein PC120_g1865 [Phytophthora cactorum]|nr:hypothetical protein PC120_g1865 [Phytophthora cactorum]